MSFLVWNFIFIRKYFLFLFRIFVPTDDVTGVDELPTAEHLHPRQRRPGHGRLLLLAADQKQVSFYFQQLSQPCPRRHGLVVRVVACEAVQDQMVFLLGHRRRE